MSVVPDKAIPKVSLPNKGAGYLLTGLSAVTAVVTALGLQSNELSDVWRNQPKLSYVAVTLVLFGVALGAIAGWVLKDQTNEERRRERNVLLWGNAALGLGLIVIAWSVVANASDSPDPTVTAITQQKNGSTILKAVVDDDKLSSDQTLLVRVEPLFREERNYQDLEYGIGRPIYSAIFGPDGHGSVHRTIRIGIPPGSFEEVGVRASTGSSANCYEHGSKAGCAVVHIPQRTAPPQLSLRWRQQHLRVHLTAFDVPSGEVQFLARAVSPAHLLARADIAANLGDDVNRDFAIPVGGARTVCVIASENTKQLHCPPKNRSRPGWAVLRVPAPH